MKVLMPLVNFHNWLSDKDFIWWPFSFLRPEKHEPITFRHSMLMTGCFGGFAFLAFSIMAFVNNALNFNYLVSVFFTSFGGFFAWFNIVTKPLWNIRARALKK